MTERTHPLLEELRKALLEAKKGDERSKFSAEEIGDRLEELGYEKSALGDLAKELASGREVWAAERKSVTARGRG